jgi:malonyl-ACP decarboxylase
LRRAGVSPSAIDYVNPHGTGSHIGDITELDALRRCELDHAWINTTKSVTGHGLSAAGAVELIAVLVQMRAGRLHPSNNLDQPMDAAFKFAGSQGVAHQIRMALKLSMGFGGINTALCLQA